MVEYIGAPFRRVVGARYLQPIAEVRSPAKPNRPGGAILQALQIEPVPDEPNRFEARFEPRANGQLYLFANDAVSLFDLDYFYTPDNQGSAIVSIARADSRKPRKDQCCCPAPNPCRPRPVTGAIEPPRPAQPRTH
jgi:hypothetical protein